MIQEWEQLNNGLVPDNVILNEWKDYTFADSALVLKQELFNYKAEKKIQLDQQLAKVQERICDINKQLDGEKNPLMIAAIETQRKEICRELERVNQIIDIYNQHPEMTQIGWYQKEISRLNDDTLHVIGYVAMAQIQLDQTQQVKWYLFSGDKQQILGIVR